MKPCIIIPVYNHGETLAATLDDLASFSLATFIVDDGSDSQTKQILDGIEAEYDIIRNMLSWRPAGLIVAGLDLPDDTRSLLADAGIPIVTPREFIRILG